MKDKLVIFKVYARGKIDKQYPMSLFRSTQPALELRVEQTAIGSVKAIITNLKTKAQQEEETSIDNIFNVIVKLTSNFVKHEGKFLAGAPSEDHTFLVIGFGKHQKLLELSVNSRIDALEKLTKKEN